MDDAPPWASASELAEYAYCPRALYYRRRDPDAPEPGAAVAGRRYHARVLGAERRRDERAGLYWAGLALGLLIVAVAVAAAVHP